MIYKRLEIYGVGYINKTYIRLANGIHKVEHSINKRYGVRQFLMNICKVRIL